jgi:hypothetical protein
MSSLRCSNVAGDSFLSVFAGQECARVRVPSARLHYFTQRNPAAVASPMLLGAPFWSIA